MFDMTHSDALANTALIFEGGGMRASFTSAVVARLIAEGIDFPWVGGISAGASCTANYLSRDAGRARESFVDLAADPRFGSWRTWMQGKGRFHAEYIYEQTGLPGEALPYDWDAYRAHPAQFAVGAVQADTGRMVYWGRDDVHDLHDLMVRVRASSTLPVWMPPATIDGHVYFDGALGPTGGFALDAAKAAGFERFVVVLTRPRNYVKPLGGSVTSAGLRAIFRRYPAIADAVVKRPLRYNRTRAELFDLERSGRAYLFCPEGLTVSNSETDVRKLRHMYELGSAQIERELPALREFLELPAR